jgi:acid phosphatase (class A)
VLPSPPAVGSPQDDSDLAAIIHLQSNTKDERWVEARADERLLYPRFAAAFGGPIDREHTPQLITLLNRIERDAEAPMGAAKDAFKRPRPYQRMQLKRMCGTATPPAPDPHPAQANSYPSGHTTVGWMAAYLLAEVAPDRRSELLERARDYGFSREICGMHFPSDVAAGRALATAVFDRLQDDAEFKNDLACARAEHSAATPGAAAPSCRIPLQPIRK